MLGLLVDRDIAPRIPVIDKASRLPRRCTYMGPQVLEISQIAGTETWARAYCRAAFVLNHIMTDNFSKI
jgi:hypothetical protein